MTPCCSIKSLWNTMLSSPVFQTRLQRSSPTKYNSLPEEFWPTATASRVTPTDPNADQSTSEGIWSNPACFRRNFDQTHPHSKKLWPILPTLAEHLNDPTCSQKNLEQSLPIPAELLDNSAYEGMLLDTPRPIPSALEGSGLGYRSSLLLSEFWLILPTSKESHPLLKEFWPNLHTPKRVFDKSCPFRKEIWPDLRTSQTILSNPIHSWRNSDWSYLLLWNFWTILPSPTGIVTKPIHF